MHIALLALDVLVVAAATWSSTNWCRMEGKRGWDRLWFVVLGPAMGLVAIWGYFSPPMSDYVTVGAFGFVMLADSLRMRALRRRSQQIPDAE